MAEPTAADAPISSLRELERFFHEAATPRDRFLVGVEHEKLPVRSSGAPVPYDGPAGVAALLRRLEPQGWRPLEEGGHLLGAVRSEESVTLEPGAQVELSGPALGTARESQRILRNHVDGLSALARPLDIRFIAGGFRPFGTIDDVPWLPKRRYDVMRAFLPRQGRLGHEMMKRTATVQVNLDFADEADATAKIRAAQGVTSVVTALYAASPITEGRPNGHKSYRAAVWLDMDESRCGLPLFVFAPDFRFAHYVEWALDVPMFFVVRGGVYHQVPGLTFRRFLHEGWQDTRPTMQDWMTHLSTLFPEVRLKRTIELRGADAAPPNFAEALAALWRGLLDDPQARDATWALVANADVSQRLALRREVPRAGLAARLGGRSLAELAVELLAIADAGLRALPGGDGDRTLLAPLVEYARQGRCPADDMLEDLGRWAGDPARLVDAWELSRAA